LLIQISAAEFGGSRVGMVIRRIQKVVMNRFFLLFHWRKRPLKIVFNSGDSHIKGHPTKTGMTEIKKPPLWGGSIYNLPLVKNKPPLTKQLQPLILLNQPLVCFWFFLAQPYSFYFRINNK